MLYRSSLPIREVRLLIPTNGSNWTSSALEIEYLKQQLKNFNTAEAGGDCAQLAHENFCLNNCSGISISFGFEECGKSEATPPVSYTCDEATAEVQEQAIAISKQQLQIVALEGQLPTCEESCE